MHAPITPTSAPTLSGLGRWSAGPAVSSTGPFPLFFEDRGTGFRCHRIEPGTPTKRDRQDQEAVADTITVDDLAKYIDEDGAPRCSLKRHPYEIEATHREIIGLHSPGQSFVKPARHPLVFAGAHHVENPWRRPWGELTTHATYRPDRQTYATLQRDDQAVIDEIDAAVEALLKTGACSALTIARAAATEILGHHPIADIKNRDLRLDAYARMAGLKRYLPGLKDYGHPIADALQVSFWISALDAETSIRAETAEEKRRRKCEEFMRVWRGSPQKMDSPGSIMVTSDVGRELLRDLHPERKLLQRYLPRKRLRVTKDGTTAARIVIADSISILHLALDKKERWHPNRADGSYTTDWTILRMRLRDRLSAREIAEQLGLDRSGSDVTRRFKAALDTISEVVDPQQILIPANRGVQSSIEKRKSYPVSRPVFDADQCAAALVELDKAARKVWPRISHLWPSAKAALRSTGWISSGRTADGILHNRAPRLFILICKYQSRGWWTAEDEIINTTIRGDGVWSGAVTVWQPQGKDTPLDLKRLVRTPRSYSTSLGSLNFCGPVIEKDGKVYPRVYGSNRIIAGGASVDDAWLNVETVTRFDRATTRADDDNPLFLTEPGT